MTAAVIDGGVYAPSERTRVERAVLAALEGLHRRNGGYLAQLAHYSGELGGDLETLRNRLVATPAVLVATGDSEWSTRSTSRRLGAVTLEVVLFVVSSHLRSHVARVHGDEGSALDPTQDPGIYQVIYDVHARLQDRTLGLAGASGMERGSDSPELLVPEMAIYRISYSIRLAVELPASGGVPVESLEHRHNLDGASPENPVVTGEIHA